MRKILFTTLFMVCSLAGIAGNVLSSMPAAANDSVFSTADDGFTNIRKKATVRSAIIGSLVNGGQGARLIGKTGNWYKVELNGLIGYVSSSYTFVRRAIDRQYTGNVYYVVIGSWETLDKAMGFYYSCPDAFDAAPIYRATADGKTVYRMCISCYHTRQKAQENANFTNEMMGTQAWVWESDGLAECVYLPIGPSGERSTPLRP